LDSLAKPTASTLENAAGFEHDVVHTKEAEAIEAVQATLGTNPQGSSATVKARLDTLAVDSGVVHKADTETITGAKTFSSTVTFTNGSPTVNSASGNPYFVSNASDTSAERVTGSLFQRRGSNRWVVAKIANAESGSNAGSDFHIIRYDDSGAQLGTAPLSIIRSTGENRIGETTAGTAHLRLDRSAGNVGIITGTGSPEGVVTAPVGSMYTDTAATNGAIRWIKATGSGNTGWKVEYGDTGWRNLNATSLSNGWAYYVSYFRMRRVNQEVYLGMYLDATSATSDTVGSSLIPTGFRPSAAQTIIAAPRGIGRDQTNVVNMEPTTLYVRSRIADGNAVYIDTNYPTTDAWPATLPGTAV
jgi:hypothetical protein